MNLGEKMARKLKPKWNRIILALTMLIVIVVLLVYLASFIISFIASFSDKRNSMYCTKASVKIVSQIVNQQYDKLETIGDSFFYGESLIFASQLYDSIGKYNAYEGKTVKLINICNNKSYSFELGDRFDDFIPISNLDVGIYEVFFVDNEIEMRVTLDKNRHDTVYTITKENSSKKVEVFADKDYFKEMSETSILKENYLFIKVTKASLPNNVYDIVIDPSFNEDDDTTESNVIYTENDESILLYDIASEVAEELRKLGYKVLVTRENLDGYMQTYGINGRIHRTIEAKAKIYIGLTFEKSSDDTKSGAQLIHSYYSSDKLSDEIYQKLAQLEMVFDQKPVRTSQRTNDYDNLIDIREIGGVALQAASFSERAERENGSFAYTQYGVNGVYLILGYSSNKQDIESFNTKYHDWAKAIATGIDDYIKR